ncbi:cucumisin-like [Mercurialis annua]|uniref:cucumisin-like n=1 Tax=Mercurialis annua TaxID=3986 RepID=UPI0024AEB372|nr:cucumisin-like [Mercurialis annua]
MARMQSPHDCLLLCIVTFCLVLSCHGTSDGDRKVYIVYMGELPKGEFSASTLHINMLQEVVGSAASDYLLHSYHRSFNGFVAKLTEEEKQKVAGMQGVVSVFPSQKKKLLTTKSWDFMGFPINSVRSSGESDMIIGMLDTGIWPESQSFNDSGYSPAPTKWKGTCQASSNFTCNNKIVGARYYHSDGEIDPDVEFPSPRDSEGHGTHTASTAAGDLVSSASLLGLGLGTARGGVPSARIAVYKICWSDGCSDADILAAFDDAIADGVDIISLSVGGWPMDYFEDPIAIGAFHSMKNGILTSNSAGNSGPDPGSVSNCSPWSLSVAASTIDRKFMTPVKLGNGAVYQGNSINTFEQGNTMHPIIFSADAANQTGGHSTDSRYCSVDSLNKTLVQGKIVVCDDFSEEDAIALGIAGIIAPDGFYTDVAFTFALPVSLVSTDNGTDIVKYLNSTSEPTAAIFKTVEQKDELAPYVVSFSSRGPNPITSDILKPDLTAPGVDILAAWSEATTVTGEQGDTRVVPYNIISGTSMSCPHASGAAAYVKSFHPTWSPAAIKSALMTTDYLIHYIRCNILMCFTAYPMSPVTNTDQELAYGSGHINPVRATDPGLVYDAGELDFVKFLCGQGYNATQLQLVTGDKSACSSAINATAWDLNYPSFALSAPSGVSVTRVYHRTVTNVGSPSATYTSNIRSPAGLQITVEPNVLSFQSLGEKQSFVVTVEATLKDTILSGRLVWSNDVHQVRSPIVAFVSDSEPGEP